MMLIVFLMINTCFAIEFVSNNQINASRKAGKSDGSLIFGGLFPIHGRNEKENSQPCGILNHERGIHRMEAMSYAVDLINKNKNILPNYTIGVDIHDTCQTGTHALEESVNFFNAKLDHRDECLSNQKQKNILGVIGAASSDVSIQVANLLRLFKVPQLSYASTSPDLNDRQRFEYFLRTVPPDTYQARAMVDIITHFNWTSVHGIYSEGNYGQKGMQKFREHAVKQNICVISASQVNGNSNFYGLLKSLTTFKETKVVVLFLSIEHIQKLLNASSKINFDFKWLASEYWGTRTRFLADGSIRKAAEGAITLTLETKIVNGFVDYFRNLKVHTNKHNPWFRSFWEETFHCMFQNERSTNKSKAKICNGTESLPDEYIFDDKVPYVIDAVLALANGVTDALSKQCGNNVKCDASSLKGNVVLESLKNVTYNGTLGIAKFDENGSTVRDYEIMEYIDGKYFNIGTWHSKLSHIKALQKPTKSHCGLSCKSGEVKVPRKGLICCYDCHACGHDKYVSGDNQCSSCPDNHQPNKTRNGCESLSLKHINHIWVIIMTSISGIGIIATFFVVFVFIYFNDTAIVKTSSRELSYALLFGILLCYSMPYVILSNPSTFTCGLSRFSLGFSFCICYSSIALKTRRIEILFKAQKLSTKELNEALNSTSQLLILLFIVLSQSLLAIIGLFLQSSIVEKTKINNQILVMCKLPQYDIIISYVFNIILIIICTVYALRTRKFPECFNEAKCVGFVMYATCIIWIAFIPVYFGLSIDFRYIAICMNSSLSATSILAGIFAPKIYIALFRPTRNIRSKSGLSIRHVYSNQSFDGESCASARRMTTLTEVDVEVTMPNDQQ